jgi:glycosyltransferase involved in cell wall biosynthesis
MPSRLIPYSGCAAFLDQKIARAINSVLAQSFQNFELIVIADGCELTKMIVTTLLTDKIKLLECKHKAVFDNLPRNTGIEAAQGDYIIYLDIDDYWGEDHLKIISEQLKDYDWVWYNDYVWNNSSEHIHKWTERACNIRALGQCGTSNVCHSRKLGLKWGRPGYAHDFYFNQQLLLFPNHTKISTPEYFVLHQPGIYDL